MINTNHIEKKKKIDQEKKKRMNKKNKKKGNNRKESLSIKRKNYCRCTNVFM